MLGLGDNQEVDEDAHERGENYRFEVRDDLATNEAPVGVNDDMIVIILDQELKEGVAMSPDTALRLAEALVLAAEEATTGVSAEPESETDPAEGGDEQ